MVPISPGLPVATVGKPPLMPSSQPRISPLQNFFVPVSLIVLPRNVGTNRGFRSIGTGSTSAGGCNNPI